ncbi:MAG: DNA double-strand break repair nuclease NurA [Candidatus Thermoplasmatota archaeon]
MRSQFEGAARALAEAARRPLPFAPRYEPLAARPPGPTLAVDGSSAVLVDNGAIWVVAHRALLIDWPGPRPIEVPATITATTPNDAEGLLRARYSDGYGLETPRARTAEQFADALRSLLEWECSLAAISRAGRGGLVLVDGALRDLPEGPQRMANRLFEEAAKAGVDLIAVAKRSGIGSGMPLVAALGRDGPQSAWAVAVPDREGTWVARLHGSAPCPFRVDAPSLDAIGRLLPLSNDAVYCGYPYPLALAHNQVALTASRVADLQAGLATEVRRQAGPEAARLLGDFHDTLDRNAPG